jgi:hypothetical protein
MPYFLYRLKPFHQLEKLAEFAAFKEASTQAKQWRVSAAEPIKLIFADNELHAEDLLSQVREPGPSGDE